MYILISFIACLLLVGAAHAEDPSALCEAAIVSAETEGNLPPRMLNAIAVVESGRYDEKAKAVRPWPWTINVEGVGHYYVSKADAIAAVRDFQAHGIKSIDVGCMQVNLMYHPDAFASLEQAFEPAANATYAVRFLNRLHTPGDDWGYAIGAYHSVTPALGFAYRVQVVARWSGVHPTITMGAPAPLEVYRAFKPATTVYGAFAPMSRVYAAFAPPGAFSRAPVRSAPRTLLASAPPPRSLDQGGKPGSPPSRP